jgi:hypothetical protein
MRAKRRETANSIKELYESCCFVDWTNHENDDMYYLSFVDQSLICVTNDHNKNYIEENSIIDNDDNINDEECFRAVKTNVPKTFADALKDPIWGEAARKEFNTIMIETKAIVNIDQALAKKYVNNGADILYMLAIYEEKIKDGQLVRKVRLVANGRQHFNHGPTYSPTPSREEAFILLHYFASNQYDFFHV